MKRIFCVFALLGMFANPAFANDPDKMMAAFINLSGNLCAKVVSVQKLELPKAYEVRCIEYRGGSGTVDYIVNLETAEVVKR